MYFLITKPFKKNKFYGIIQFSIKINLIYINMKSNSTFWFKFKYSYNFKINKTLFTY